MRLGVITDEVTQDFREALEFAKEYGLDCVELRSAYEKGPFDYTDEDIERIRALSEEYGIPVAAISSPFFKCEYSEENIRIHNEKFKRLVGYAKRLGATRIRCFDFFKNEAVTRPMIVEAYREAINNVFGKNACMLLRIRPYGASVVDQSGVKES